MSRRALCVPLFLLMPAASLAADREFVELKRDLGLLQDAVKLMQQSQDEKLNELKQLLGQAIEAATRASNAAATVQNSVQQSLREQEKTLVAPVVGANTKIDQLASDFRGVQQAVADMGALMTKLQTQVTDLTNAVKIMQAPAAPPPPSGDASTQAGPPTISATELYTNARRDYSGGKTDLALQEFSDYLKWYGATDLAPNAQYYIGEIHFSQGNYDQALQEFDMVLEKYPDNSKTPDALYMKGRALVMLGRRTDGAEEFRELMKRFPSNDLAKKACAQIDALGLKCGTPPRAPARRKK
jgi:tol-pal system protein YbgF